MSIKGTATEKNLLKSFAGESQARNRYTFFASVAKKEGFEQIAGVFAETADQEKEHAKKFFKYLEGGDLEITATYPAGKIGTTKENLLAAAMGEHEEWEVLYAEFAEVADKEGFAEIAETFRQIAKVEAESNYSIAHYDLRFAKPLDADMLKEVGAKFDKIITVEDGSIRGGVGEAVTKFLCDNGYKGTIRSLGIEDKFIEHGTPAQLYALCGYDAESIARNIKEML
jgi:rubrerythrin